MTDTPWIVDVYDEFVSKNTTGCTVEQSRDAVAKAYVVAVEAGDMPRWLDDLETEGRQLFNRLVLPERERRKGTLVRQLEWIVDAILHATVLGDVDPMLDRAFPLGDGSDKALRHWTADDLTTAITERYRSAAATTAAAREFDRHAQDVKDLMYSRSATEIGGLLGPSEAAA